MSKGRFEDKFGLQRMSPVPCKLLGVHIGNAPQACGSVH